MLPAGGMRSFHLRRIAHGLIGMESTRAITLPWKMSSSSPVVLFRVGSLGAQKKGSSFAVEIPLNPMRGRAGGQLRPMAKPPSADNPTKQAHEAADFSRSRFCFSSVFGG
jgi:hypothetical protein